MPSIPPAKRFVRRYHRIWDVYKSYAEGRVFHSIEGAPPTGKTKRSPFNQANYAPKVKGEQDITLLEGTHKMVQFLL